MKITIITLGMALSAASIVFSQINLINQVNALEKPNSTVINNNQAADLITQPATINSEWSYSQQVNTDTILKINHSENQKMNILDYINNPELFFQSQENTNKENLPNYEPVDYLRVPKLDSGITVQFGNW